MKRDMMRLACALAVFLWLCAGVALADVELTQEAALREYAGEDNRVNVILPAGSSLLFTGFVEMDTEGVYWFEVNFRDEISWVSSRYSRLTGQIGNGMELSFYYGQDMAATVRELDRLGNGRYEGNNFWYNDHVTVWGDGPGGTVDSFLVYGNEYTIYDCMAGMDLQTVIDIYLSRGLDLLSADDGWYTFGHHGMNSAGYRVSAYDTIVTVVSDLPGVVTQIELDPYRG